MGRGSFLYCRAAAEAVIDDPVRALPFLSGTVEAWHALLCPISHRGQVNWFGRLEDAARFKPSAEDPGGPLVVMTSAGFDPLPREELQADMPRRIDFITNVHRVLDWYASLPGDILPGNFQVGSARTDGMTVSLWRNDTAMMEAAYKPGIHRTQLDRYKTESIADRTSFTRARRVRSVGCWSGKERGGARAIAALSV